MGQSKQITVELEGVTPLLCNKFTDKAQMQATSGNSISTVGDRGTPMEIAESKLYLDLDGDVCIPQPNIFSAIIEAGKYFKAGKSKVTTKKSSLIPSCVDIDGISFKIIHKEPWTVDTRPVRIPSTGGRILCHRPCFHDWKIKFDLVLDTTVLGVRLLREIVDKCGRAVGLGDYRPDCKGPFGKFKVSLWSVKDENDVTEEAKEETASV